MKGGINHNSEHGFITSWFSQFIEWGNRHFTLAQWLFKKADKQIFAKLEAMMIIVTFLCLGLLFTIHIFAYWIGFLICVLLIQRLFEFFIVYSRNFIFNRGRIFSLFHSPQQRGEWLILMFGLSLAQLILIFAIWYQMISLINPGAFSTPLNIIDSLYFSFITFVTVGYGDIHPVSTFAKIVNITQMGLIFYTLVIVVNGLISLHFSRQSS